MRYNTELTSLKLNKAESIGNSFLTLNHTLSSISLPNALIIRDDFLPRSSVTTVYLPKVKSIGHYFLSSNYSLMSINLPEVETIGAVFLGNNWSLKSIYVPNLQKIGSHSLQHVSILTKFYAPKLKIFSETDNRLKLLMSSNGYNQPNKDDYKKLTR